MNPSYQQIIEQAYTAFNARDAGGVLKLMHPQVRWPKAFEGDFVTGPEAVREYWQRQWSEIDPRVDPTGFEQHPDGTLAVTVHQVVKDMQGNVIADGEVKHIYRFEDGLIREMNVEMD